MNKTILTIAITVTSSIFSQTAELMFSIHVADAELFHHLKEDNSFSAGTKAYLALQESEDAGFSTEESAVSTDTHEIILIGFQEMTEEEIAKMKEISPVRQKEVKKEINFESKKAEKLYKKTLKEMSHTRQEDLSSVLIITPIVTLATLKYQIGETARKYN